MTCYFKGFPHPTFQLPIRRNAWGQPARVHLAFASSHTTACNMTRPIHKNPQPFPFCPPVSHPLLPTTQPYPGPPLQFPTTIIHLQSPTQSPNTTNPYHFLPSPDYILHPFRFPIPLQPLYRNTLPLPIHPPIHLPTHLTVPLRACNCWRSVCKEILLNVDCLHAHGWGQVCGYACQLRAQ